MTHVQLDLDDDMASYVERRAASTGEGLAAVILTILRTDRANDERQRRIDIALAALKKPAYHSGLHDVAENHDEYIGQALDEEVERWRRG